MNRNINNHMKLTGPIGMKRIYKHCVVNVTKKKQKKTWKI